MYYIKLSDCEYIKNKYHDSSKLWDGHSRFICGDGLFSAETGMNPADIMPVIMENAALYKDLQIRVCGWNAYFVNLSKTEQDCFIRQAEAL